MGPVHLHSGTHNPGSTLQVIRISSPSPEAQALRSDTGGAPSPGADGTHGSADEWPEVNLGTTWEDYGPRLEVLKGYTRNEGVDYIAFDIQLPSGEMKPAQYIKLEYGEDPLIYGMIDGDPHQYVESFQATTDHYVTNLSLHAAHTPYTTDHSLPNNATSSEDSFPCLTPEVTTTNAPSPDPLPIPP